MLWVPPPRRTTPFAIWLETMRFWHSFPVCDNFKGPQLLILGGLRSGGYPGLGQHGGVCLLSLMLPMAC